MALCTRGYYLRCDGTRGLTIPCFETFDPARGDEEDDPETVVQEALAEGWHAETKENSRQIHLCPECKPQTNIVRTLQESDRITP